MASITASSRATVSLPFSTSPPSCGLPMPPPTPHCVILSTLRGTQIHRLCSSETTVFDGRHRIVAALDVSREAPPALPASDVAATELPEFVRTAQQAWDKIDDKYAVASLGIAAVIALWTSIGLVLAIDRVPLLPGVVEVVGIGYSGWFAYRNLVFKPGRVELLAKITELYKDVVG